MDIAAFGKLYRSAAPFVHDYEAKQVKLEVMLTYSKECSANEKELIVAWIKNSTNWLSDNEEKYNKMKAIASIPTTDIEELYQSFKAIYGEGI